MSKDINPSVLIDFFETVDIDWYWLELACSFDLSYKMTLHTLKEQHFIAEFNQFQAVALYELICAKCSVAYCQELIKLINMLDADINDKRF